MGKKLISKTCRLRPTNYAKFLKKTFLSNASGRLLVRSNSHINFLLGNLNLIWSFDILEFTPLTVWKITFKPDIAKKE